MSSNGIADQNSLPNEKEIMKQILAIHDRDKVVVDVYSLFTIVKDVLDRTNLIVDGVAMGSEAMIESGEVKISESFTSPCDIICKLSCEIGCNASPGAHETTMSVLKTLSGYSWDAKVVLTLAALALNYGELWFLAHVHPSYQLAKSMACLKQLPALLKPSGPQKDRIITLYNLIKNVLELTECVVKLEKITSKYTVTEVPALSGVIADIPLYVYWTIRIVVVCATQISNLITKGQEYSTKELVTLTNQINDKLSKLSHELDKINRYIGEYKRYKLIAKLIEVSHSGNVEILKALIVTEDELLIHGTTKKTVKINDLRRKKVLLLISGIEFSNDDLLIPSEIYEKSKPSQGGEYPFEVVWIPIVEQWTDDMKEKFEKLQSKMLWYTVQHPSAINGAAIRFIKDRWHFNYQPIVVVLDPTGKVENPNAFPMMKIWGKDAFPFTEEKEKTLWEQKTWVELLGWIISPEQHKLIVEGKLIFWYGGNDNKWIQEFEEQAELVQDDVPSITTFNSNKNSKFWTNLETMLLSISKIQPQSKENYVAMQELQKLLHYKKKGIWTMVSKGSKVVTIADGTIAMETLKNYDTWKDEAGKEGFDLTFKKKTEEKIPQLSHDPGNCFHLSFSSSTGKIPESLMCPTCNHVTEKLITFRCCHDDGSETKPTPNST